ncbi:hypothetical protein ACFX1Z_037761 [Malus domestica]
MMNSHAKLKFILAHPFFEAAVAKRSNLLIRLNNVFGEEESYLRQRSRILWLCNGDINTRFFHQCANIRKANDGITGITNLNDGWVVDDRGIENSTLHHFDTTFSFLNPCDEDVVLQAIDTRVSVDMN